MDKTTRAYLQDQLAGLQRRAEVKGRLVKEHLAAVAEFSALAAEAKAEQVEANKIAAGLRALLEDQP